MSYLLIYSIYFSYSLSYCLISSFDSPYSSSYTCLVCKPFNLYCYHFYCFSNFVVFFFICSLMIFLTKVCHYSLSNTLNLFHLLNCSISILMLLLIKSSSMPISMVFESDHCKCNIESGYMLLSNYPYYSFDKCFPICYFLMINSTLIQHFHLINFIKLQPIFKKVSQYFIKLQLSS